MPNYYPLPGQEFVMPFGNVIKFENGQFEVSLRGDQLHINSASGTAGELLEFRRNVTKHLFNLALIAQRASGQDKSLPADEQVEFKDDRSITLEGGKYEIGIDLLGRLVALRYGEPWRQCVGDNLMFYLWSYACDMEDALRSAAHNVRTLDVLLNGEKNAATQASLCDIISQLQPIATESDVPIIKRILP